MAVVFEIEDRHLSGVHSMAVAMETGDKHLSGVHRYGGCYGDRR